ncbi:response regulator [Roseovarius azorensis]|nr:response regulator [Roseovarius azorensis]
MKDDTTIFQRRLKDRAREAQHQMRVLIVDDDPSILHVLQTALAAIDNYSVAVAACADSALDMIEGAETSFDCFLLDIQMPETDGIVLLRKIRRMPDYSETPIIMLTAMSERNYIDDAFIAGATDYITKPFDLMDLRGRMNAARRLVKEKLRTEETKRAVTILKQELQKNTQFNFDDPLVIEGADRHLRFMQFNNYIDQLSRGQIFKSHCLAILLQDAQTLYDVTDCGYFRHVVNETALCLQSATSDLDCMFSYRGSGLFLVIVHDDESLRAFPTEEKLNHYVQAMLGERGSADSWVQALVGKPFSMRSLSRSGIDAAINRAVDSVQQREIIFRQGDTRPVDDPTDAGTQRGTHTRRRIYERVLMELYGEESYLNLK